MKWWRGDFHAHTLHSDGVLTPAELMRVAQRAELDFFAITDHNTWTYPEFEATPDVTVIGGVEVTVDFGHFNVFTENGQEPSWVAALPRPWALPEENPPPGASQEMLGHIRSTGLRISINHPLLHPWAWTDSTTGLGDVRFLEVFNDPDWPENQFSNPATVDMWTRWLNAGYRATAIGGSDFHNPDELKRADGRIVAGHRIGFPSTYVLAADSRPSSLLEALDHRRAYVTMGPTVTVSVLVNGNEAGIGDDLGRITGPIEIYARSSSSDRTTLQLVRDGSVVATADGKRSVGIETALVVDDARSGWFRFDVRTEHGALVAVTNPIFFGAGPNTLSSVYGDFVHESASQIVGRLPEVAL